jgi:hypothetical protein
MRATRGRGRGGTFTVSVLWLLGFARVGVGGRAGGKRSNEREGKGKARGGRAGGTSTGREARERKGSSRVARAPYTYPTPPTAFSGRARSGTLRETKCKSSPIIGGSVGEHVASADRAAVAVRHGSGRMDHGTGHA